MARLYVASDLLRVYAVTKCTSSRYSRKSSLTLVEGRVLERLLHFTAVGRPDVRRFNACYPVYEIVGKEM